MSHVPQADGLVDAAAGEDVVRAASRVDVAAEDVRGVPGEDSDGSGVMGRRRVDVPEVEVLVVGRGGEVASVAGPRDVRASPLVPHEHAQLRAVGHAPNAHGLVSAR